MSAVILWKSEPDLRPWASVGPEGREHLLAQLLHANLLDRAACDLVAQSAMSAAADSTYERDLGFFDSVAVHFEKGIATLDHAISGYGTFTLAAAELAELVSLWASLLESPVAVTRELKI